MSKELTTSVSCVGGLDTIHDPISMFGKSGFAQTLVNFESAHTGGYRRIDGFSKAIVTTPAGTSTPALGVYRYCDGIVACQDDGVYYSNDLVNWLQVNKVVTDANEATVIATGATARTNQGRNQIHIYKGSDTYGTLLLTDGVNSPALFKIQGTGGSRTYTYKELSTSVGFPSNPLWSTIYKERYVVAQDSMVYWSGRFTVDDATTASAGSVDVGDTITGLKSFRDILYVFCENSIHAISQIDEAPNRQQVAKNIGCISGWSVQEIGGDIVFLSRDGVRTIAATTRLGDVELSTITHPIYNELLKLTNTINDYDISSVVLRNKNQYRLFFNTASSPVAEQLGFIGSLVNNPQIGISWEWSRIRGIEAPVVSSENDLNILEKVYHGDYDGFIYNHVDGTSFDGAPVHAIYKTVEINWGDSGIRKTLYAVKVSLKAESTTNLNMTIRYDFSDSSVHQPQTYTFTDVYPAAIFGAALYGESRYGANTLPIIKRNVEGSGVSASFKFETNDTTSLYKIHGFHIDLQPNGRVD